MGEAKTLSHCPMIFDSQTLTRNKQHLLMVDRTLAAWSDPPSSSHLAKEILVHSSTGLFLSFDCRSIGARHRTNYGGTSLTRCGQSLKSVGGTSST